MIRVELVHTFEFDCELDLPDDATEDQIRQEVESLMNDDFRETGKYQHVSIYRYDKNITGDIQPSTPNLNP